MAVSVRAPYGSLLVGVTPPYAWGASPGVPDILNMKDGAEFRGDLVIHQSRTPDHGELRMKFKAEDHDAFPLGALLGVVRVKAVAPPCDKSNSPWALPGYWHWHVCWPRPFREPLPWRGHPGLFEVEGKSLKKAVDEAEYEAKALWWSMPESEREELLERAALAEYGGMGWDEANRLVIAEWQAARVRGGMPGSGQTNWKESGS